MAAPAQPRRVESAILRDSGVSYGRFRPLPRADGLYVVYDPELPLGRRSVGGKTFATLEEANGYARACAAADPRERGGG